MGTSYSIISVQCGIDFICLLRFLKSVSHELTRVPHPYSNHGIVVFLNRTCVGGEVQSNSAIISILLTGLLSHFSKHHLSAVNRNLIRLGIRAGVCSKNKFKDVPFLDFASDVTCCRS